MRKVMVFGTFDGLHDGHRAMLAEARSLGDYLIAVLAQDHIVAHLKGRLPKKNLAERFEHLSAADGVDKVAIGDGFIGTWNTIKRYRPDVVAIGHDQDLLEKELRESLNSIGYEPKIVRLKYYERNDKE